MIQTTADRLKELAIKLPKAELHLHIEGTLEPEMMFKLANQNNIKLRYNSVDEIKAAYNFTNLQSFLDLYYEGASVLITENDFYDLATAYLTQAHKDGLCHVEIFFDPQTHTSRGISFETVLNGLHRALEEAKSKYSISYKLILCFLRHLSQEDCIATLNTAKPYLKFIDGVGLDSSELGNPPEKFEKLFTECRKLNLRITAHAGEEGPPDYVWQALDVIKATRIDHGVKVSQDEALIKRIVKDRIPLTVCPLSNVRLKVVSEINKHNLCELLDKGILAMINSDDPAYFGGYLGENFKVCIDHLKLTKEQVVLLCKNSVEASWLDIKEKQILISDIDEIASAFTI